MERGIRNTNSDELAIFDIRALNIIEKYGSLHGYIDKDLSKYQKILNER